MRCFQHSDPADAVVQPRSSKACKPWRRSWTVHTGTNKQEHHSLSEITDVVETSDPSPALIQSGSQRAHELQVFTYAEMKTATRNFYRGNFLGEGGFGCVYSGVIKRKDGEKDGDGKIEVAVKQLNQKGLQGHKQWLAEVSFLGRVEHPNLVKLIGYCAEDDSRGIQRLLVYEFMPNKSLDEHLFSRMFPVIPWETRVRIALGTAQGLAYLHEDMDFQVIFRDFKTSNVLLDNGFNAKLSDFGLARQGPEFGISHVTTAIVGTVGYAAPEYLQTGHLTAKSDVWSFGIVLLEMLSGRRAMDKNKPRSEQRLIDWVRPLLRDGKKFPQIMDPRLEGAYPLKAAHRVAALASQCLAKQARSRPKMSEVAESLRRILELSAEPPTSPTSVVLSPGHQSDEPHSERFTRSGDRSRLLKEALLSVFWRRSV